MKTAPEALATAQAGDTVDFVVSSGLVTLSDLVGQPLSVARDILSAPDTQLVAIPTPDYSCASQPGFPVTRQSLAPGDVPQKSEVTLTYCAG
jgi:beta-lactam-binding protein with PASTA domain